MDSDPYKKVVFEAEATQVSNSLQYRAPKESFFTDLAIKLSGGKITTKEQAQYALAIFAGIAFVLAIGVTIWAVSSSKPNKPAPRAELIRVAR